MAVTNRTLLRNDLQPVGNYVTLHENPGTLRLGCTSCGAQEVILNILTKMLPRKLRMKWAPT
ncbi:MAG TPA: hypothetical protein VEV41_11140, partial [Terriglobales bacterium]|nr:hypothetical protein [Terriglobales bacterium]